MDFAREKVVSTKNHFSGAGALMCVIWERYGLSSQSGLHHYMQRSAHFTMVSISRYVKLIASGRFSQTSHIGLSKVDVFLVVT